MEKEERQEQEELFQGIDLSMLQEAEELVSSREEQIPPNPEEEKEKPDEESEKIENQEEQEQEQEEQEEDEEDKKEDPSSQETDKKTSPFAPYAKLLVEEGVLPNFDIEKWDGSPEGLVQAYDDRVNSAITQGVEEYKSTLNPRIKWLQDNLDEGVSLKELLEIEEQGLVLNRITDDKLEEDESIQKELARQYYSKTTKFRKERIEKEIERLEASGELKEEAKSFFEELKEINAQEEEQLKLSAQKEREQAEKQQEELLTNFKKTLDSTEEIVSGLKVNDRMRDRIFKTLTTAVDVDEYSGTPLNKIAKARAENPIDFEIKLAYLFELTDGFKDWSPLASSGKKAAYKDLEVAAKSLDEKGGTSSQRKQTQQSNSSIKANLDELEFISKQMRELY